MKKQTPPSHLKGLRPDLTSLALSPERLALVKLMRELQFGRIENMSIRGGQPILDHDVKIVRVARLGSEDGTSEAASDDYELKQPVRDLFDRLARFENGTVLSLEFRHGLPFVLETMTHIALSAATIPAHRSRDS